MAVDSLTSDEVSRAWAGFVGSPIQVVLDTFLKSRVEDAKMALETCSPQDLLKHQATVAAARALRSEIHSKDGPNLKKQYG